MNRVTAVLLGLTLLAVSGAAVEAAEPGTLEVCTSGCPYAGVQAAIEDASDGDTVLVHDGTYVERIDFMGKAVTVRSVNGASATIIDGAGAGTVVTFHTGEGAGSVLEGFTLTNGDATFGGGINCEYSSPTITACIVRSNAARYGGGIRLNNASPGISDTTVRGNAAEDYGGGMYLIASSPVIERSFFSGNDAGISGGGIYCVHPDSSPEISRTVISGNTASDGGGMYVMGASPTITFSTVQGNSVDSEGGGIYFNGSENAFVGYTTFSGNAAAYGGGIYCSSSSLRIERSVISRNRATMGGGGISCYLATSFFIKYSAISGNSSDGLGGGVACSGSSPSISDSTFSGNRAGSVGGAFYLLFESHPTLIDCTLAGNAAVEDGGGIYIASNSSATVINSILWGDSPQEIVVSGVGIAPQVSHSDVEGGDPDSPGSPWPGEGNIVADPLFADPWPNSQAPTAGGDYRIQAASPCRDRADEAYASHDDQEGDWRPQGPGYDMGADEYALLGNGSFEHVDERIPVPWKGRNLGRRDGRVTDQALMGTSSFAMTGSRANKKLFQVVYQGGVKGDSYTLSGFSRAAGTLSRGGFYGIQATFHHTDGTRTTYRLAFTKDTHDWQYREKTFTLGKRYRKVVVSLLYARQGGQVWFDQVALAATR